MEKINIAELLKDCPRGMELDCLLYDNVTFISVDDEEHTIFPIKVRRSDGCKITLTKYGQYAHMDDAKCIIFPKGKTTWEGFVPPCEFKDGDIVATTNGLWIGITTGGKSGESIPTYCVTTGTGGFEAYFNYREKWKFQRLATKEEKAKLFKAIKDNGYKWNTETKTLEKLPKFKVGDKVLWNYNTEITRTITAVEYDAKRGYVYWIVCEGCSSGWWGENELTPIPNKFDITTLKPFESRVLARSDDKDRWKPAIFGGCARNRYNEIEYYYALGGTCWRNCIPYEENQHLLGTTNDCDEYFKNWKE